MNATGLEDALRATGIRCTVEAIGRLAVLAPDAADGRAPNGALERLVTVEGRREALRLSRSHGFTHLALELPRDQADGAPLHRD